MKSKYLKIRPEYAFLGKGVLWFVAFAILWLALGAYINSQTESIAEAIVIQYLKTSSSDIAFVSIDGKDPSNAFIQSLNDNAVIVQKPSLGILKAHPSGDPIGNYYFDRATGKRGRLIRIGKPQWLVPFFVWVEVAYPGEGERFSLRKSLWGWSVTGKRTSWIA